MFFHVFHVHSCFFMSFPCQDMLSPPPHIRPFSAKLGTQCYISGALAHDLFSRVPVFKQATSVYIWLRSFFKDFTSDWLCFLRFYIFWSTINIFPNIFCGDRFNRIDLLVLLLRFFDSSKKLL